MGKVLAVDPCMIRTITTDNCCSVKRSVNLPVEFQNMPLLLPPDLSDNSNPDKYWVVYEDWKSPAIDGIQACVRGPIKLMDGRILGFFTDGISVPQLAWTIFGMHPFSMPEFCGALPHDIVYSAELSDRKTCDRWLRGWEKMAGTSKGRSNIMYGVVNAFGGIVWNKHTKESVLDARSMCQIVKEGEEPMWGELPNGMVAVSSTTST